MQPPAPTLLQCGTCREALEAGLLQLGGSFASPLASSSAPQSPSRPCCYCPRTTKGQAVPVLVSAQLGATFHPSSSLASPAHLLCPPGSV